MAAAAHPERMARELALAIGREITLARANLGLTIRAAARLAGVSPTTQRRVEDGDPRTQLDTLCRCAVAVGLKLWGKAFPARTPSLRDTGQLRVAEHVRSMCHRALRVVLELAVGNGRSIDTAIFGALEIVAMEIERLVTDFQAQYRSAVAKRDELAALHQRPVRLVLAIEDTRRNRELIREHEALIRSALPAGSREIARALRSGEPINRDGILWVRPNR